MNLRTSEKDFVVRGQGADLQIIGSENSILYTPNQQRYIDFTMGWAVGNLGWENNEIRKRLKQFDGPYYISPNHIFPSSVELSQLLAKISPGKLNKSFRATTGTEAVEIAMQIAMAYTKRSKFISIEGSYHGDSIATKSIGSPDFGDIEIKSFIPCHKIKPPLDEKAIRQIEKYLSKKDVAAFIMEPIICNLNVLIPSHEFMNQLQAVCKTYDTLLILDEVITGFCRTGRMFASEHFDLEPDIMCLAKAITAGFAPLGATLTTERIASATQDKISIYSTYGWHPFSVEAALANIQYLLKHKGDLDKNADRLSKYFNDRLTAMKFKDPPEIRIKGLAIGLVFEDSEYAETLVQKAKRKHLLLAGQENGFAMFPALNMDLKTAEEGLDLLESCL